METYLFTLNVSIVSLYLYCLLYKIVTIRICLVSNNRYTALVPDNLFTYYDMSTRHSYKLMFTCEFLYALWWCTMMCRTIVTSVHILLGLASPLVIIELAMFTSPDFIMIPLTNYQHCLQLYVRLLILKIGPEISSWKALWNSDQK